MILQEWRKKHGYSQVELAQALESHAHEKFPDMADKRLKQRTLGYWEQGTLPRKGWLKVLEDFTKRKVTANDFVNGVAATA